VGAIRESRWRPRSSLDDVVPAVDFEHCEDYECPNCDDDDGAAARAATAGVLVVAALVFVGA
jgi:hypothetical protein